jgi:hypothetical protein
MFSTSVLKGLAAAGSISRLCARGVPSGFLLFVTVGMEEAPVKAYRGQARVFKRLDAVAKYVKELGLDRFEVQVGNWSEGSSLL